MIRTPGEEDQGCLLSGRENLRHTWTSKGIGSSNICSKAPSPIFERPKLRIWQPTKVAIFWPTVAPSKVSERNSVSWKQLGNKHPWRHVRKSNSSHSKQLVYILQNHLCSFSFSSVLLNDFIQPITSQAFSLTTSPVLINLKAAKSERNLQLRQEKRWSHCCAQ